MKPNELYDKIQSANYTTSGLSVDWYVEYNETENKVILLFQGTNQKEDWKINLDFPVKMYKHQENFFLMHRGYKKAWKSVNDEIMNAVCSLLVIYPAATLLIAGHSYGGALSLACAEDVYYRTGIKAEVITFGAPHILFGYHSKKYIASCCEYVICYEHVNDPVPKLLFFYCNPDKQKIGQGEKKWFCFDIKWHLVYGDPKYYSLQ